MFYCVQYFHPIYLPNTLKLYVCIMLNISLSSTGCVRHGYISLHHAYCVVDSRCDVAGGICRDKVLPVPRLGTAQRPRGRRSCASLLPGTATMHICEVEVTFCLEWITHRLIVLSIPVFYVGLDRRRHTDLLLLRHLSGGDDLAGKLQ